MSYVDTSWHILGAGAIGCLWAYHLQTSGKSVVLITRDLPGGHELKLAGLPSIAVNTETAATLEDKHIRIAKLLLTTKTWQTEDALASIANRLSIGADILFLQNGMQALQLADALGNFKLYAGTTTDGVFRRAPWDIVHAGQGETFIGPVNKAAENLSGLLSSLHSQCLRIKACNDIERRLWRKLALNCVLNPLAVIFDCCNGDLIKRKEPLAMMRRLADEASIISYAATSDPWHRNLFEHACRVAEITADNINSMLQDTRKGNLTEINEINGFLCQQARRLALPCDLSEQCVAQINQLSSKQ